MLKINNIFAVLIVLSLVFVGIPQSGKTSAMQLCPMSASQMDSAKSDVSKHCSKCPKMTEQQKSKGNCCGDDACSKKCSTMSLSSIFIPTSNGGINYFPITQSIVAFYSTLLPSLLLNTQDRPPKFFS